MNRLPNESDILRQAVSRLKEGYCDLPEFSEFVDSSEIRDVLLKTAVKLHQNYPYYHPFYLGQMLTTPHPVARLAYQLALFVNPNNHALDGGIASSEMEKEVVKDLSAMFNLNDTLGHLTSGGTMANLEALWVSGQERPGKHIVASSQAHYTHRRISKVLGLEFEEIECDSYGRMDLNRLESALRGGSIGTVVVTLGTTGFGAIDPLHDILKLRDKYDFRIHVDAAYGGYFILDNSLDEFSYRHFQRIQFVDSVVVDPHKHGMQPYGCGCVLFSDPYVGRYYKHNSPYTYFTSDSLHLGEISLECSRAGASAVALWATHQIFPLDVGGLFAHRLSKSRQAAHRMKSHLLSDGHYLTPWNAELDILVWMPVGGTASEVSLLSQEIFDQGACHDLHMALIQVPRSMAASRVKGLKWDKDTVTCLRACLMKPEHLDNIDEILNRVSTVTENVFN